MTRVIVCLLLAVACASVQAIDINVKFAVYNCKNKPIEGAKVVLKGCVDYPISCETNAQGKCELGRALAPGAVPLNFCYGNARHLCQWEVQGANAVYVPNQVTMMNGYFPITPFEFSGCKCDGTDHCQDTMPYPTHGRVVFKPTACIPDSCKRDLFENLLDALDGERDGKVDFLKKDKEDKTEDKKQPKL